MIINRLRLKYLVWLSNGNINSFVFHLLRRLCEAGFVQPGPGLLQVWQNITFLETIKLATSKQ